MTFFNNFSNNCRCGQNDRDDRRCDRRCDNRKSCCFSIFGCCNRGCDNNRGNFDNFNHYDHNFDNRNFDSYNFDNRNFCNDRGFGGEEFGFNEEWQNFSRNQKDSWKWGQQEDVNRHCGCRSRCEEQKNRCDFRICF